MRRICGLLAAVIVMLTAGLGTAESDTDREIPKFRDVSVHDPSVIRADDGLYYIFGSHMAAARSADLIRWEMISRDAGAGCTLGRRRNVRAGASEQHTAGKSQSSCQTDIFPDLIFSNLIGFLHR